MVVSEKDVVECDGRNSVESYSIEEVETVLFFVDIVEEQTVLIGKAVFVEQSEQFLLLQWILLYFFTLHFGH